MCPGEYFHAKLLQNESCACFDFYTKSLLRKILNDTKQSSYTTVNCHYRNISQCKHFRGFLGAVFRVVVT